MKLIKTPRFLLKQTYNSIIPCTIFQTWSTTSLPPKMYQNLMRNKLLNPNFKFILYDDNACREFIKNNFQEEVLHTYDKLIPGAYKADLWRYCILYIYGGIYMDIKYTCVNGFKFIALTEKEHFVRDINSNDVYTALIVTNPKNEIMLKCINKIVENVKKKFYGNSSLHPTGPTLLGENFLQGDKKSMELYHSSTCIENKIEKYYIVKNDRIILQFYEGYRDEQTKYQKNSRYTKLWNERNIYIN